MENKLLFFFITSCFFISCSPKLHDFKQEYGKLGYVNFSTYPTHSEYYYNYKLNGSMDAEIDTFGIFYTKLPTGIKRIDVDKHYHFFSFGRKSILIHLDYSSRCDSMKFKKEEFTNTLIQSNLNSFFQEKINLYKKNQKQCYRHGNTWILFLNFPYGETYKHMNLIQGSFKYLPY